MCKIFESDLTFGVEIECVCFDRDHRDHPLDSAARAIAAAFGVPSSAIYRESHLSARVVPLPNGRKWKVEHDGSLPHGGAEVVSPPLHFSDAEELRTVCKALKSAGFRETKECGCHTHVDAASLDAPALRRLVNLFASKEFLTTNACAVLKDRLEGYSKVLDHDFVRRLNKAKPATLESLAIEWYNDPLWERHARQHYDQSRYHTLNLHPVFESRFDSSRHPTVEFRLFNGTVDFDEIVSHAALAVSMVELAKASKSSSPRVNALSQAENPKYAFRCFLLRLGFIGSEYEVARKILLKNLSGDTAWLHGKDLYPAYHAQVASRRAG